MNRISVSSTNISSIGHCADSSVLEVEFLKGGIYNYYGISEQLYHDLLNAGSKGQFLNQYIKNAGYTYTKVG
ncbi:KTSC domain-containing protein [Pelosinus fermentans]|uniref:KTSC domain-containing protein n=1 Tax=Pelosinus fermentans TaxID=365349 RepID=UPI00026863E4|nr:KTSC domain-containing protein [Pelosinus fermentans]OAM92459.1 KTSC domain containing protein [Pelosinus fermentans DSM 17108]SDQ45584.1 KTSC domain-containing protein [Pelosinus fermentans]